MSRDTLTKRIWQYAGAPSNGVNGTYASHEWLEKGDLLVDISNGTLYQNTNTQASPTWTLKAASGAAIGVVGDMAAAGTSTANSIGVGATSASIDHVHALGSHDHSGATKGGSVAMGVVGSMAAAGTSTANGAGTGTAPAAIDHVHAIGAHDHSGATKGGSIALAAMAADIFTADADGRGKFQTGIFDAATVLDLFTVNSFTNAILDSVLVANAFAADADSRAKFADGIWTAAKMAAGLLSADGTGRALIAAGFFDAATALSAFADNSIPGSKVNWSYGATASTITPDDSASAGIAATVSRSDHVHANTCAAPADGSLAAANAEGVANNLSRSDHAHRAVLLDGVEFEFGTSYDAVIGWETGDASNNTIVIGLADANQALHITDKSAIATDFNVAADTHPSVYVHSDTTPATDYVKIYHDATSGFIDVYSGTMALAVDGTTEAVIASTGVTINDGSADRDFRVETNGAQYAIYADGGKDAIVLGANADASSADQVVTISRAARSNTATVNFFDLAVIPAGAITTTGVTAIVSTVYIAEPNITIGGDSVTVAASLYVAGEPTEGGTNYGIACAASIGLIADAKNLAIGASADVIMRWSTADADNHAFAIGLGASLAMHICQAADIATDWNVAADSNPALYIHGAATPATEYLKLWTDETDAHIDAVGAVMRFDISGTEELNLAANALNLCDSALYGSEAENGNCIIHSTSHATKGFIGIPTGHEGLKIGGTADRAGTVGDNALHIYNGAAAPAGALANGVSIYSEGGECKVLDAAGNSTTISPHTEDGDYVIHSFSNPKGETITIHLEKMLKALAARDKSLAQFVEVTSGEKKRPVWLN
jgi:hypothetical protein